MSNAVVDKLLGDLQAKYGENAVMRASEVPVRDPITSGSLALDFATGIGGLPSDRVIEVAGDEGCIQGDAEINVNRAGKGFRITLRDLVHRFNGGKAGGKVWNPNTPTYVQREVDGVIRLAKVSSAWASGVKTTYTVTTESGRQIRATDEHPFLTERGWLRLDELKVDDEVHVRGERSKIGAQFKPRYREMRIPNHPHLTPSRGTVPVHRVVAEAQINGMSVEDFAQAVDRGEPLKFLDPAVWAVHHKDHDSLNNDPDNLQVLTHAEHKRLHAAEGTANNVQLLVTTEKVVSVEKYGDEETFDIEVEGDPHNFVANGFVVHNSGKTTLGLLTMLHFLDKFPHRIAVILDTEHKLTMDWVEYLVGTQRMQRVIYLSPDHMEQATNMYVDAVSSGQVGFVLFDSIGGSPTKAATEKEAEKVQVGGNANAVTKFARLASTHSSKYTCLTFCINQVRTDMEGFRRHMTPGGHGFKHACVMRIKLRRSTSDKVEAVVNGEKMVVGFKVFASIIKNQMAAPGRMAWWWFYNQETPEYGFGIDTLDEIIRLAVATKVVTQNGSWYSHPALPEYKTSGEHKVQGLKALGEAINADPALEKTVVAETMAVLKSDGSLASEVAPFDPDAVEQDLTE